YFNSSDNPTTANRVVTFQVDDGQSANHASNTQARTISITAVNDAPVLAGIESATLAYTENDPATQVTATITVTDPDTANLSGATAAITGGFNAAQDTLSFSVAGTSITGSYDSSTGVVTFSG